MQGFIVVGTTLYRVAHISAVVEPRPCTDFEKLEQGYSKETPLMVMSIVHISGQSAFHYSSKANLDAAYTALLTEFSL